MANRHSVLVVDDDDALRTALLEQLQGGEFAAVEAATLAEARSHIAAAQTRFEVMLLDVSLPDGDGRDFCRKLRQDGIKTPIIMLTASAEETDVVRGLDSGANDYIAKAFRLNELLARMRAQLRNFEQSADAAIAIGPYVFHPADRLLLERGRTRRIRLTDKETAILKFLCRAGDSPVTRQILLNEVWGYNAAVTTHTLETHIYRLRQKIEQNPATSRLLVTEGGGYRLNVGGRPSFHPLYETQG